MDEHKEINAESVNNAEGKCDGEVKAGEQKECCCHDHDHEHEEHECCHHDYEHKHKHGEEKHECHCHDKEHKHEHEHHGGSCCGHDHDDDDEGCACCGHTHTKKKAWYNNPWLKMPISLLSLVAGFIMDHVAAEHGLVTVKYFNPAWIAVLWCGIPIFINAIKALRRKKIIAAMLISIAIFIEAPSNA